jgi:hypothetical protein
MSEFLGVEVHVTDPAPMKVRYVYRHDEVSLVSIDSGTLGYRRPGETEDTIVHAIEAFNSLTDAVSWLKQNKT